MDASRICEEGGPWGVYEVLNDGRKKKRRRMGRARVRERRLGMSIWADREPNQTRSAVKPNAVKNAYRVDEGKGRREQDEKNSLGGV